jgi:ABC-type methionine transport system permease subunit
MEGLSDMTETIMLVLAAFILGGLCGVVLGAAIVLAGKEDDRDNKEK